MSVGYSYPTSITASRLSLLFLLRRIFGMRLKWFRICWYLIGVLVLAWFTMAITFGSLSLAKKVSLQWQFDYAIPVLTFTNAFTDICLLTLPVGVTKDLRLPGKQRAGVMAIFALGSVYVFHNFPFKTVAVRILIFHYRASVTSLVRAIRSIQSKNEGWDPRYQLYSETMIGLAEAGSINICACLPTLRPLFRGFVSIAKRGLTTLGVTTSTTRTKRTLASSEHMDEGSIVLKDNIAGIARTVEWNVDSTSDDGNQSRDGSQTRVQGHSIH